DDDRGLDALHDHGEHVTADIVLPERVGPDRETFLAPGHGQRRRTAFVVDAVAVDVRVRPLARRPVPPTGDEKEPDGTETEDDDQAEDDQPGHRAAVAEESRPDDLALGLPGRFL